MSLKQLFSLPPPPLIFAHSTHGRHHVGVVRVAKRRVYRGGCGEHVSSVTERQVAHGHVSGQRAEGGALVVHALGKLLIAVAAPLHLLGFVGHFPVACLYSLLLHGQRPVHLGRRVRRFSYNGGKDVRLKFLTCF